MEIAGNLKKSILDGNAVLFLGAGVGAAIGLHSAQELSNMLYTKAKSPDKFAEFKDDLANLVARLDKDTQFGRKFTNDLLLEYFNDAQNYKNIDLAKRLLKIPWRCIITTNYDRSIELANDDSNQVYPRRLLVVRNPHDPMLITDRDSNKLRYFKIHGCAYDLLNNPKNALDLVITNRDFRTRAAQNTIIWDEIEGLAYHCPIIFVGFRADKHPEVLDSVFNTKNELQRYMSQPNFPSYAVLKDVDDNTRFDLEQQYDISLLQGGFEDFLQSVENLFQSESGADSVKDDLVDSESNYKIKNGNERFIYIPKSSLEYSESQFSTFYEGFFEKQVLNFSNFQHKKKVDAWQNNPSFEFTFSDRPILRTQFKSAVDATRDILEKGRRLNALPYFLIRGARGCGKTVFVHQLVKEIYESKGHPVLLLNSKACYVENEVGKEMVVPGWERRLVDEFLSKFEALDNEEKLIPILVADNMMHRARLVQNLEKHLYNQGKKCLVIFTVSPDELPDSSRGDNKKENFLLRDTVIFDLKHQLDDIEIDSLCNSVLRDRPDRMEFKSEMIRRASDERDGKRDILFILFMWFDERFRRLIDIILEESQKIKNNEHIKNLYVAIALFRQYHLDTNFSLSFKALNITIDEFKKIEQDPLFRTLISVQNIGNSFYAETRHPQFNRMMVNEIMNNDYDGRIEILCKVIRSAGETDLEFLRSFFVHVMQSEFATFSIDHLYALKKATEDNDYFRHDYVINHQFANRLIKEGSTESLDSANEYLDLALQVSNDNPIVIHTKANLYFARFKRSIDMEDTNIEHFEAARDYFQRVRVKSFEPEEHDYVTEIDMIAFRLDKLTDDSPAKRALLTAELNGLILEALKVIPNDKQNFLKQRVQQQQREFHKLDESDKEELLEVIRDGNASHLLLEYYAESLIKEVREKRDIKIAERNWHKIKEIVHKYWKEEQPVSVLTTVGILSKKAFIKGSQDRFDLLFKHYNNFVRYQENNNSGSLMRGEYMQMLSLDAFVLGNFYFLWEVVKDFRDAYGKTFPRFLKDEYILDNGFYNIHSIGVENRVRMFLDHVDDFHIQHRAKRFEKDVFVDYADDNRYYNVVMDPSSKFYIRGVKKELPVRNNKIRINFCVKFAFDGLKVSDPRVI